MAVSAVAQIRAIANVSHMQQSRMINIVMVAHAASCTPGQLRRHNPPVYRRPPIRAIRHTQLLSFVTVAFALEDTTANQVSFVRARRVPTIQTKARRPSMPASLAQLVQSAPKGALQTLHVHKEATALWFPLTRMLAGNHRAGTVIHAAL